MKEQTSYWYKMNVFLFTLCRISHSGWTSGKQLYTTLRCTLSRSRGWTWRRPYAFIGLFIYCIHLFAHNRQMETQRTHKKIQTLSPRSVDDSLLESPAVLSGDACAQRWWSRPLWPYFPTNIHTLSIMLRRTMAFFGLTVILPSALLGKSGPGSSLMRADEWQRVTPEVYFINMFICRSILGSCDVSVIVLAQPVYSVRHRDWPLCPFNFIPGSKVITQRFINLTRLVLKPQIACFNEGKTQPYVAVIQSALIKQLGDG